MESSARRASPLPGGESPNRSCCPSKLPPRDGSSQPSFTTSCLTTVSAPSHLAPGREGPSYFSSGRGASQSQQSSDEGAVPSSKPSTAPRANAPRLIQSRLRGIFLGTVARLPEPTGSSRVARPEKHDIVGDDFGGVVLLILFVRPLAGLQSTLDEALAPFGQVLATELRELSPADYPVPFRPFLLLAPFVRPGLTRGNAKIGHRLATRCESHFRVRSEIANQDRLVYASSHMFLPLFDDQSVADRPLVFSWTSCLADGAKLYQRELTTPSAPNGAIPRGE